MKASLLWPAFVVGIALTSLAGAVMLVRAAASDPSFAVEPDYYRKAARWDEHAARVQTARRSGWRVEIVEWNATRLAVRVLDEAGRPLEGATVEGVVFPSARAGQRRDLRFVPGPGGTLTAPIDTDRAGLWHAEWTIVHAGAVGVVSAEVPVPVRAGGEGAP
jgi:hypothetical protein